MAVGAGRLLPRRRPRPAPRRVPAVSGARRPRALSFSRGPSPGLHSRRNGQSRWPSSGREKGSRRQRWGSNAQERKPAPLLPARGSRLWDARRAASRGTVSCARFCPDRAVNHLSSQTLRLLALEPGYQMILPYSDILLPRQSGHCTRGHSCDNNTVFPVPTSAL